MPYTVAEAAKAIGKSKAAIFRAVKKGKLSATREESRGIFLIDPAELRRVFPATPTVSPDTHRDTSNGTSRDGDSPMGDTLRFAELQGRLADAHRTIDDLRSRLDAEAEERRKAQTQLTALLTDQRPSAPSARRSWWRRVFGAGVVLAAVMSGTSAYSEEAFLFENGNDLYAKCSAPEGSFFCRGFVAGVVDSMTASENRPIRGWGSCRPQQATLNQVVDIVRQFLQTHPELRHTAASVLVARALAEAFPCRSQ